MRLSILLVLFAVGACVQSDTALAHFMTQPYLLPVPFWMYAYGCAATLVVTFAVLGYFSATNTRGLAVRTWQVPTTIGWSAIGRWGLTALRVAAVGCLLLTIA